MVICADNEKLASKEAVSDPDDGSHSKSVPGRRMSVPGPASTCQWCVGQRTFGLQRATRGPRAGVYAASAMKPNAATPRRRSSRRMESARLLETTRATIPAAHSSRVSAPHSEKSSA